MAVIYNDAVKDDRLQVVADALDAEGEESPAKLVIGTSALSGATGVLVEIELDFPAATVSSQVLTLANLPKEGVSSAAGTAEKAELRDGNGTVIVSGLTVDTSDADVIINNTTITESQTVRVTAGTIAHA